MVTLSETNLKNGKRLIVDGYLSYNKNRQNANMGGVATCVASEDAINALKVGEGVDNEEYIVTRQSQFIVPVNIINWYGQQEGRSSKAEIEQTWSNINAELAKIELCGEHAILMGDMNRHVGVIIEGNNDKVSAGGKLIIALINTKKYVLLNSTNVVTGGLFT